MQTKVCTKCKKQQEISKFGINNKAKDGLQSWCKECKKQRYLDNKAQIQEQRKSDNGKHKEYMKNYHETHKEQERKYKEENKEKIKIYRENYEKENKDKRKEYWDARNSLPEVKERKRAWYEANRERKREQDRIYYELHKEERKEKNRQNQKLRYEKQKQDKMYLLNNKISKYITAALQYKTNDDNLLLSYTTSKLREHIQSQFTFEMNWDNYGSYWEVDHILPRSLFSFESEDDEQFKICWSLANLRPLEKSANRSRPRDGSDIPETIKQQILNQVNANNIL